VVPGLRELEVGHCGDVMLDEVLVDATLLR